MCVEGAAVFVVVVVVVVFVLRGQKKHKVEIRRSPSDLPV